jgi:hypothetical protein
MTFEISKFRTEIDTRGILKTNRFLVKFGVPESLGGANGRYVNKTAMITLRCDSVQWPGVSFMTMDTPPRAGYGATELIPYAPIYEDITLNFIVDKNSETHKFFFEWMNSIVNLKSEGMSKLKQGAFEVGYKDKYSTDIEITMYRETGVGDDHAVMTATLYRAFPKALPSFELNWGSENEVLRINVPFAYSDYFITYNSDKPATR